MRFRVGFGYSVGFRVGLGGYMVWFRGGFYGYRVRFRVVF